ncbi:hypothetical protein DPMN_178822 [Dreissena polymorpha]|uniref:Uncharacterized protein n=1 Tax=Dreissena polymorpha TaxID=45954 RepID=A0A9D4IJ09_DREPO|nr:hypothetical protein DPMN_178822 [Dreissena polymorpha]
MILIFVYTAVDESAVIVLKYKGGGLANLTYHTAAGRGTNSATIMGPKGQIQARD